MNTSDRRTHRSQLFRKYLTVLVVLVGGTLAANGVLEGYFSYQENQAALVAIQHAKASGAAARIGQFVEEVERQVREGYQSAPTAAISLEQERADLLRLLRLAPSLTEASYLDSAGREQVHVSRLGLNVPAMEDFSREPKFVEARTGRTYFGPVYFRGDSEPYMTLGVADRRPDPGVTAAEANLKFIWDVVSAIEIGEAGYAYVVDPRGHLGPPAVGPLRMRPAVHEHHEGVGLVAVGRLGEEAVHLLPVRVGEVPASVRIRGRWAVAVEFEDVAARERPQGRR